MAFDGRTRLEGNLVFGEQVLRCHRLSTRIEYPLMETGTKIDAEGGKLNRRRGKTREYFR